MGEDSVSLVNKLLNDLVKASEAYQIQKRQMEILSRDKLNSSLDISKNDLKSANMLLEKENNEIHEKLINQDALISKLEVEVKKLELEKKEITCLLGG